MLPQTDLVLVDREDGGNLVVNPPRAVWERGELTAGELTAWSHLVAATGAAMLRTLPQLEGGCINYWEAGNWALNDAADPAGPKTAPAFRSVHLHLLGRSRFARSPDWAWGEAPRFPGIFGSARLGRRQSAAERRRMRRGGRPGARFARRALCDGRAPDADLRRRADIRRRAIMAARAGGEMTTGVFLTVLLAALIHAVWNAAIKGSEDKLRFMTGLVLGHVPFALAAFALRAAAEPGVMALYRCRSGPPFRLSALSPALLPARRSHPCLSAGAGHRALADRRDLRPVARRAAERVRLGRDSGHRHRADQPGLRAPRRRPVGSAIGRDGAGDGRVHRRLFDRRWRGCARRRDRHRLLCLAVAAQCRD